MEFREVVRKRRMVRNYKPGRPDEDAIRRICDAARRAPSAGFTQGQYFVVVTDADTRAAIAMLANESDYVARGYPAWMSSAPVHVVVCTNEADYHRRYREPDKLGPDGNEIAWPVPYWHVDAGAALMSLLLAVVDEGLAAGFFGVHRLPRLKELLSIPAEVTPIGVVTIGRAAADQPASSASRGWRPEQEVVRWERW